MNRVLLIFVVFMIGACGGSLSDEQRKKMKEAREAQSIVKVTEAEITDAAFAKGRMVMTELTSPELVGPLSKSAGVKIHWLEPGAQHGLEIEQQL